MERFFFSRRQLFDQLFDECHSGFPRGTPNSALEDGRLHRSDDPLWGRAVIPASSAAQTGSDGGHAVGHSARSAVQTGSDMGTSLMSHKALTVKQ